VKELFKQDQDLSDEYNHKLAGGRWDHMMDQTRIGYTSWQDPKTNVMPAVREIDVPAAASLGVAVDGADAAWPNREGGQAVLPPFDSVNQQRYSIDVFNRGRAPFASTATADQPWIQLSESSGQIEKDARLWVSVDWQHAPVGEAKGTITVARQGGESVAIDMSAVRSATVSRETLSALGGLTGPVAIAAQAASRNVAAGDVRWQNIPDYGRGTGGMAIFPVIAESVTPPANAPRLEYDVYLTQPGDVQVDSILGPTLDFVTGRGMRFAVSIDDEAPQVVDMFDAQHRAHNVWQQAVRDNARTRTTTHHIGSAGVHIVKFWMVDPGVVLEKLVVHQGDLSPSYFGPPEALAPVNATSMTAANQGAK
jgi:hypothetical protein